MDPLDRHDKRWQRIRDIIKARPGMAAAELNRATNSIPELQRNAILDELINDGLIEAVVFKRAGRGRPTKRYYPTEYLNGGD